eukprot:SAG31_NODE_12321_length_949_cov_1.881176_1_plen_66_part_00
MDASSVARAELEKRLVVVTVEVEAALLEAFGSCKAGGGSVAGEGEGEGDDGEASFVLSFLILWGS